MNNNNIVKVQTPLRTNEPVPMALIYNEGRGFQVLKPITVDLLSKMNGKQKKYFYYKMQGDELVLLNEAPWQDW